MGFGFEIDRMTIAGNAYGFRPISCTIDKKENINVKIKRPRFNAMPACPTMAAGEAKGFNREILNLKGDEP